MNLKSRDFSHLQRIACCCILLFGCLRSVSGANYSIQYRNNSGVYKSVQCQYKLNGNWTSFSSSPAFTDSHVAPQVYGDTPVSTSGLSGAVGTEVRVVYGDDGSSSRPNLMVLETTGATSYFIAGDGPTPVFEVRTSVYLTSSGSMTEHAYPPTDGYVGKVQIYRTGSTSSSQVVYVSAGGNATFSPSYDWSLQERVSPYSFITSSTTIPAGASSIELWLVAWNDSFTPEVNETASLSITGDTSYSVGTASSSDLYTIQNVAP